MKKIMISFLIIKFLFFFGMEFVLLGIYAILWQQMIKRFELSVAYANRSMSVLWSIIWAVIFFHDTITIKNILLVLSKYLFDNAKLVIVLPVPVAITNIMRFRPFA